MPETLQDEPQLSPVRKLVYALMTLLALGALFIVWESIFRATMQRSYLFWCLEYGPTVLILNALVAALWREFNENDGLVSANPNSFLANWLYVIAGISLSFANATRQPIPSRSNVYQRVADATNSLLTLPMVAVVSAVTVAWALLALPFLYFLFLISAAPIRLAIGVRISGDSTRHPELALTAYRFDLAAKPTAAAFALGSLVVWVFKLLAL
jgi:hypothetical protein